MFQRLFQSIAETPFLKITFALMISLDWKGSSLMGWRRDSGQIMNTDRKNKELIISGGTVVMHWRRIFSEGRDCK